MDMAVGEALPATSEVDRMVASFHSNQGARVVRNQSIADKLLAWSGLVEELQEEEANLQKGVAERWAPYIVSSVNLGPYVAGVGDLMQGIPSHISTPTSRQSLTADNGFKNHVLDRFKWQQIALRDIEPVNTAVDEILGLLEKELNK